MKKLFTLLFFSLFFNIALSQTNTFTVQYFDVKPGAQSDLAALYDSFLRVLNSNPEVFILNVWIVEMFQELIE